MEETMPQLQEIEELRAKINNIMPSAGESLRYIGYEFAAEFIYHCNALSGSKISKGKTREILSAEGGACGDTKSAREVTGLYEAYREMLETCSEPLSAEKLKGLHIKLHGCIEEAAAGVLMERKSGNCKKELEDFARWFNASSLDAIHFAAEAYARYIFMHPFRGSNGRMARLVMNFAFMRRNFSVVVIPSKWRAEYERIMENFSMEEFSGFLQRCVFFSQKQIINKKGNLYSEQKKRHIRGLKVDSGVLDFISRNPGCKATQIKEQFSRISFTKLQRILHGLAKDGKIEFSGPTKTGGYFCKEASGNAGAPGQEGGL